MPLFLFIFHIFTTYIHSFNHIHPSPFAGASLHLLIAWKLSGKTLPVVPRIELGPALQQADVLPIETRRTITTQQKLPLLIVHNFTHPALFVYQLMWAERKGDVGVGV
jgi:hypothetical protein